MTTLVEEMARIISSTYSGDPDCDCGDCSVVRMRAQAALDCVIKHLFQMSQTVDTEYRGYLKAIIAHLDQERSRE
jgi:hypothetical protein